MVLESMCESEGAGMGGRGYTVVEREIITCVVLLDNNFRQFSQPTARRASDQSRNMDDVPGSIRIHGE